MSTQQTAADRELLELAAKAAGISLTTHPNARVVRGLYFIADGKSWNPLTDDGDAARLAATLGLSVEPYPYYSMPKHSVIVKQRRRGDQMRETNPTEVVELYGDDATAATRLAITRCAAAIARATTQQDQA